MTALLADIVNSDGRLEMVVATRPGDQDITRDQLFFIALNMTLDYLSRIHGPYIPTRVVKNRRTRSE